MIVNSKSVPLDRWLTEPAEPLAALRIVVALLILVSPQLHAASELAADPFQLDRVPEGLGFVSQLPLGPGVARVLEIVALSSGACALLGFYSRSAMAVLTVSAGLAFSLSQRSGAVMHDMHFFWLGALLAVSPCGDAWSLDAWGREVPPPSPSYGVPLAFVRTLLGFVYFFPGLHKLTESGRLWISAENIQAQLYFKWFEFASIPPIRIDRYPALCTLGAVLVIAFELTFIVLVHPRRTRVLAAAAGLAFHAVTQVFFYIQFPGLWACYVVLLPFGRRRHSADARGRVPSSLDWPLIVVGTILLGAAGVQGVRGKTQAWPFACYPTFANLAAPTIDDIAFEATFADGRRVHFSGREAAPRTQFEWRRVFYLTGAHGEPVDRPALSAFAVRMAARQGLELRDAQGLVALRERYRTAPEAWGRPVSVSVLALLSER
jgi:hypothetical protein